MIFAILFGYLVGIIISVPVGPVNVLVIKATLLYGNKRSSLPIALGSSMMDFIYLFFIMSGLSLFSMAQNTSTIITYIGILVMIILGIKEIRTISDFKNNTNIKHKHKKNFSLGVLLYVSNPTIIATLSTLLIMIKSFNLFSESIINIFSFAISASFGAFSWFYVLSKICLYYRDKMSTKVLRKINIISGSIIIIIAVFLFFRTFK